MPKKRAPAKEESKRNLCVKGDWENTKLGVVMQEAISRLPKEKLLQPDRLRLDRLPSEDRLPEHAKILGLDALYLAILRLAAHHGDPAELLIAADQLTKRRSCAPVETRSPSEAPQLVDWVSGKHQVDFVVVGDRVKVPPRAFDILTLPASTRDLQHLLRLRFASRARVISHRQVQTTREDTLRAKLRGHILVIGSPSVNLVARRINPSACFRFEWQDPDGDLFPFINSTREDFSSHSSSEVDVWLSENSEKMDELRAAIKGLSNPKFYDPIGGIKPSDYQGVLSLARNPWSPTHSVILAAGENVEATMAAIYVLSGTAEFFDGHPLGGVFQTNRVDHLDSPLITDEEWTATWVTREYTRDEYRSKVPRTSEEYSFTEH